MAKKDERKADKLFDAESFGGRLIRRRKQMGMSLEEASGQKKKTRKKKKGY